MNRRILLAGSAALVGCAALPAIPAAAAETLAPALQIDRAGFINRLHEWALHCPEMGRRIDALIANVDYILGEHGGLDELLHTMNLCDEKLSRDPSLDYLIIGRGNYPNGQRHRLFPKEEVMPPDECRQKMVDDIESLPPRDFAGLRMVMGAIKDGDYGCAREWATWGWKRAGVTIAQI